MTAGRNDITIEQGATFTYSLIWKDSNSVPIDLTGYSARMQVRKTYNDSTAVLDLSSDDGNITLGGALGTIDVVAGAAATAIITIRAGVYDLELESPTGVVTRLIEGKVTVNPEVTR